jgi:hypothetical protein
LTATVSVKPAYAIKEFGEQFARVYVEGNKSEEFKKLVSEAKCNVCHIDMENKKKHNPYGDAMKEAGLDKKKYQPMLKNNPDQAKKEIEVPKKKGKLRLFKTETIITHYYANQSVTVMLNREKKIQEYAVRVLSSRKETE